MAALPATYAARIGAEVLAQTGELQSNAWRRIAETAQLTVDVLFPLEEEIYPVDEADQADQTGQADQTDQTDETTPTSPTRAVDLAQPVAEARRPRVRPSAVDRASPTR